jgi:hypothetical protein
MPLRKRDGMHGSLDVGHMSGTQCLSLLLHRKSGLPDLRTIHGEVGYIRLRVGRRAG